MIQITLTRRVLALIVSVVVAVAALATGAFVRTAQADHRFNDIADGTFFHDSTAWLADNGIADGLAGGRFGPKENITRGQASYWFKNYNDNIVDPHLADTTDVHGIADTSALATDSDVATALSAHAAATNSAASQAQGVHFEEVTTTPEVVLADALTVPAAGHLTVTATWQWDIRDGEAGVCWVVLDGTDNTDFQVQSANLTSDTNVMSAAVTGLFSTTAGSHTMNLVCQGLASTVDVGIRNMTTVFVPGSM